MAKKGMNRPQRTHTKPENEQAAVPEIQGKAKNGKKRVRPVIAGTNAPAQKVYHTKPMPIAENTEEPISELYAVIDNDLARDNLENDITAADLQDM